MTARPPPAPEPPRAVSPSPMPDPLVVPRPVQRIGGLGIGLAGAGGVAWLWHDALRTGAFRPAAVLLFGAFAVVGFALALIPGYREERLARGEDLEGLEGAQLITPAGGPCWGWPSRRAALALWWRLR